MGLFEKVKTDISSFNWNKSQKHDSNQGNLPEPPDTTTPPVPELEKRGKDIDAQYKKLGGNESLRGENNLGFDSPFVIRDIGDSYPNFQDGIFRGGLPLQVARAAEDAVRIAKWQLTPKGVLWGLKQALLQNMNPREETRKYNTIKTLGSIVPTVHAARHAKSFLNPIETPRYQDEVEESKAIKAMNISADTQTPGTIGENIAAAFGFGKGATDIKDAKNFNLGSGKIRTRDGGKTLYAETLTNTLQVPYGGEYGNLTKVFGPDKKAATGAGSDFIKFRIRDAVNGKWLIFPAHLGGITDTVTPEYTSERYIGRPDSVHIYTGTNRSVSFDFKVAAMTKQEIPIIQEKMNYLVGLAYPTFRPMFDGDTEKRPVTPYVYLTIGDLFVNTPGYFSGITMTFEENAVWELDNGMQIPQYFTVACEFVYIGKYLPTSLSKHYEVPHLKDHGQADGQFQTFGDQDPTTIGEFPQGRRSGQNTTVNGGKKDLYWGKGI